MNLRALSSLPLFASLLLPGCILVTDGVDDDDTNPVATEDMYASSGEIDDDDYASGSTSTGAADESGSSGGGSSGGDGPVCSDNVLSDPSFEAGSPSEAWSEKSELFGSPLCDDGCSDDAGAVPSDGQWWAWFGGTESAESAAMSQAFTLQGTEAMLSFHVMINASGGSGDDTFVVSIDGDELLRLTDADVEAYGDYVEVELDASAYADGEPHELTFAAEISGQGMTNFFLDDVALMACDDEEDEGTGSTSTGGDGDTDGGDTDGSSSGGSSGSTTG